MTAIDGLMVIINDIKVVVDVIFSFMSMEDYKELLLVLLTGEITLITLFFALIPMLLDKRKNEYYLGTKVNDFFLFYSSERGELLETWIYGMGILSVNILCCFLELIVLGYICSAIFWIFVTCKICVYLKFISKEDDVREAIMVTSKQELEKEPVNFIEKMVIASNDDWKIIHENIAFLSEQSNSNEILGDYINRLFDERTDHKQKIFFEVEKLISKNKYCFDVYLDTHEVYKFFRNQMDDYNKEEYYSLMFSLILNDFRLFIKDHDRRGNYAIMILQAIEKTSMTETNKSIVKDRIIRDLDLCSRGEDEAKIGEENYYRKYYYIFSFIKQLIEQGDIEGFGRFIKLNRYIDFDETFTVDIYITCMVYLYYLIQVESTEYVNSDEKKVLDEMKDILKTTYDFDYIVAMTYLYEDYIDFIQNLRNVSEWWDRMNIDDVKSCVVPPMIETVAKCIFLIFGKTHLYGKYEFSSIVIDMFKYDIKNGMLSDKTKFDDFFAFIDYEFSEDDYCAFESQITNYIVNEYKENALLTEIDKEQLQDKLKKEEVVLTEKLSGLKIFNSKDNCDIKKASFTQHVNKSMLDIYYQHRSIVNLGEIERCVEREIYECILETIGDKHYIAFSEWRELPNTLSNINNSYYYLHPQNDMIGNIPGLTETYNDAVSKFKVVDTTVTDKRLLVEEYKCCFNSISMELRELNEGEINSIKKQYSTKEEQYYKEDSSGVEIPYTESEIEELIKNTNLIIIINIEFGLDVMGKNNIAFIRKDKNN